MSSTALAPAAATALTTEVETRGFVQLTTLAEAMKFAEILCRSDLVPKDYKGKPENAVIAMQMGFEIGLQPLQAVQGIAVVNGRPSVWGDALRALILSAPDLEDIIESDDGETATCIIKRKGRSPVERTFSMKEAAAAGLAGGNVWKSYPKRMRQNRAFAFAARDAYADRLKGIASAEEQADVEPTPEKNVTPVSEPQRASAAAAPSDDLGLAKMQEAVASHPLAVRAPSAAAVERNGATDVLRRVKLLESSYIAANAGKAERWEVKTDQGVVYVLDESLHQQIETCLDTDHRFALTVKLAKVSTGIARIVTQLDADDEGGDQ